MAKTFSSNINTGKGTTGGHSKPSNFSAQTISGQNKSIRPRGKKTFSDAIKYQENFQVTAGMRIVREQQAKAKRIAKRKKDLEKASKLTPDAEELEKLGVGISRIPKAFEYVITQMRAGDEEVTNDMIAGALRKIVVNEKLDDTETRILQLGWKQLYARAKSRGQAAFSERNIVPHGEYYSPIVGWY